MITQKRLLLALILLVSIFLRFYHLAEVPVGIHADGAAQAYNAFSLTKTGKDMYGASFPIMFRANGSYQPPLYTYLTILPVYFFGNTLFSARFMSAVSGVFMVVLTFLFVKSLTELDKKVSKKLALFAALVVGIAPQIVYFNRLTVEASLSAAIFSGAAVLFIRSLKNIHLFPVAMFLFGLGTHAYYSERIISTLIILVLSIIFRKVLIQKKRIVLLGFLVYALTQIPHVYMANTGAFSRRFDQVSYIGTTLSSGGSVVDKIRTIGSYFIDHYVLYFSPDNLFFDTDIGLGRTSPGLGAFYAWFLIPFLLGVRYLIKNMGSLLTKVLVAIAVISPLPAALTGDDFYPLRVIVFLWCVCIIIALGMHEIWSRYAKSKVFLLASGFLVLSSIFFFFVSYFAMFKYEAAEVYGYHYIRVLERIADYPEKTVIVDVSPRAWGAGIRTAYLLKADPVKLQKVLSSQLKTSYYSEEVNANEVFEVRNIMFKPINWGEVCVKDLLLVGDRLSFSDSQIKEHGLRFEFVVNDLTDNPLLFGYSSKESGNCENMEIKRQFE